MNKEELKQIIKEVVNGRIDALREEVSEYRKEHKAHIDETKPILEAIKAMTMGRKAVIWLTSLIAGLGGSFLIIKKIFF